MKKLIYPLIIIFLLGFFINAEEDDYKFKVLAAKGGIKISMNKGKWKPLKNSMVLKENDKIKLSGKSYLGLVHESGRTVELDKPGEYSINKLNSEILKKKDKLSKKLTEYIVDEMSEAEDLFSDSDYHESMGITGAVERSSELIIKNYDSEGKISDPVGKDMTIRLVFPFKTSMTGPGAEFKWYKSATLKEYKFTIRDRFDEIAFSKIVSDTSITINIDDIGLERGSYYFWNVSQTPEQMIISHDNAVLFLSKEKSEQVKNDLRNIEEYYGSADSPMKEILKASYFEKNELFIEADRAFRKALEILPETENYEKMYAAFKYRMTR